jgi:predicted nucleic acid-binding protein
MYAIDTNLLVYAHNTDSEFNEKSSLFLERVMNEWDESGNLTVCLPSQVIQEFINVITRQNKEHPLSLTEAIKVIDEYLKAGITIIHQKESQITTFLDLLKSVSTRKKIFDIALTATLKDNDIEGLYTVNVSDFSEFSFLKVENPLVDK